MIAVNAKMILANPKIKILLARIVFLKHWILPQIFLQSPDTFITSESVTLIFVACVCR